jgi:hypothetical protein
MGEVATISNQDTVPPKPKILLSVPSRIVKLPFRAKIDKRLLGPALLKLDENQSISNLESNLSIWYQKILQVSPFIFQIISGTSLNRMKLQKFGNKAKKKLQIYSIFVCISDVFFSQMIPWGPDGKRCGKY